MDYVFWMQVCGLVVISTPALLVCVLGLSSLVDRRLNERATIVCVQAAICIGLAASVSILAMMLLQGTRHVAVELGNWVEIPGYHFSLKIGFDRLSVPFAILTFVLCGTIAAFAKNYMHREPGFNRFFVLYSLFLLGMVAASLAGTIETLFAGWELVGLSSALLVAYFQERPAPVRNGLRVWAVYRVSDAALLLAALLLHHLTGHGDFGKLMGSHPGWPEVHATVETHEALIIGLLLLVAAAGKSALVPFSSWLPRAMEGPTPSSAVFYGALSVHLGAYLLLRVSPVLEMSPWLGGAVIGMGLLTAVYAALVGRAQTDIKSALSFASLTQVGIIVAEIGLASFLSPPWQIGLRYFALIHILGHACLRTLQFVRAPTLLHDYHQLENALGSHLPNLVNSWERGLPLGLRTWLYRFALERGYLDSWLDDYLVQPFLSVLRFFDSLERSWMRLLSGDEPTSAPSPEATDLPAENSL
ncbi:MAG: proton-conducting transporter membrane subunit [Pirellulaceae bacterium]